MMTASLVFVLFSALAFLEMVVRGPSEERMMIKQFGNEFQTYMQHTGRFLRE